MRRKDWRNNKKKKKIYDIFDWKITNQLNGYLYKSSIGKNFICSFRIDEKGRIYNIILELNNVIIHQFPIIDDSFVILDCEKTIFDFFEKIKRSLRLMDGFNWGNYEKVSDRTSSLYCLIGKDVYVEKNHNDYYLFMGKTSEPRYFHYKSLKVAEKKIAKYLKDILADLEKISK